MLWMTGSPMPMPPRKVAAVRCSAGATDEGAKVTPWAAVSPAGTGWDEKWCCSSKSHTEWLTAGLVKVEEAVLMQG